MPKEIEQPQPGQPEKEEKEPLEFVKGQEIKVRRTSGRVEGDWNIFEIDKETNTAVVHKKMDGEETLVKRIPIDELKKLNPLEKLSAEKEIGIEKLVIEKVDDKEAKEILQKVEIHGDEFKGQTLTPKILEKAGLLPDNKVVINDSIIWFSSSPYNLGEGRLAVVAYVEKKGKIVARSYYRSNSQGIWRYLPEYSMKNGEIGWYGKGYGEASITLPIALQKALSEISREEHPVLELKNPDLIFAGTARKLGRKGTYFLEVEYSPQKLEGNFHHPKEQEGKKVTPEQVRFANREDEPDFEKLLTSWEQKSDLYGDVSIEVFPSKNGKLKFMFCRDASSRVWIGGIENDSKIQSTGLKQQWVDTGDLATPAFEYKTGGTDQTGSYGNERIRSGPYVDTFENYLSKIPIIQRYMKERKIISPIQREREKAQTLISEAKDFRELFKAVEQTGGLQGTEKFYEVEELKKIINRVRSGELDTAYITRAGNLKQRVEELLKIEKLKEKISE